MANVIGALKISFSANSASFVRETRKAQKSMTDFQRASKSVSDTLNVMRTAFVALGAAMAFRSITDSINTYTELSNRLKLVTKDANELEQVQKRLFDIAQKSRGPLEATTDLYFRLAKSTEHLGMSQKQLADVTETVNKAVSISGTTSQAASAALFQLGQGLAAGALRGQELNSVMEQTPRVAQAIADGLGITIGELRDYGKEGKITAQAVIGAFQNQAQVIDGEFSQTSKTITQAMTQIENVLLETFGKVEAGPLIDALDELRKTLQDPKIIEGLQALASAMLTVATYGIKAAAAIKDIGVAIGEAPAKIFGESVEDPIERLQVRVDKLKRTLREREGSGLLHKWIYGDKESIQAELELTEMQLKSMKDLLTPRATVGESAAGAGTGAGAGGLMQSLGIGTEEEISKAFERQFESVQIFLLDQEGQLAKSYENRYEIVQEALNNRTITEIEAMEMVESLRLKHELALINIQKKGAKARNNLARQTASEQTAIVLGELRGLLSGVEQHNRALFEINKVAAIAETIILTHESAQKAYAAYSFYPPLAAAMAGIAYAAGFARVSAIQSTSFGGGGGVGGAGGGGSAPTTVQPVQTIDDLVPERERTNEKIVNLNVSGVFSSQDVVELVNALNEAVGDGVTLNASAVIR